MTVEIICVGTELLLGNIVNTNGAYLARECAGLGLSCFYQSVVGDNEGRLTEALENAIGRSDIVILSGGLGPTEDDLTKETAARVMGRELIMDEASREAIAAFFAGRGIVPTDNNWKQALVPEGAKVLPNSCGTAPGIILFDEKNHVILLPGPPNELVPMFEAQVKPYLKALTPGVIYSKMVKLCGAGESSVEAQIRDMIDAQTNPTLATYAKTGEVDIRVTASAATVKEAKALMRPAILELKKRFGKKIFTTKEEVSLEEALVKLLVKREMTVTCAESCTGGLLSGRLVNVPGVSDIYRVGLVTYSNKAKRRYLHVKKKTLEEFGAVSAQTAAEMAEGAAKEQNADVAIATTGIAGPDGGTEEKPVGLVYIACFVRGKVTVKEYRFSGSREKIRESTVVAALTLARDCVMRTKA